jgi:two-component system cell cycle sensor histidine kinase/response regulator CckA
VNDRLEVLLIEDSETDAKLVAHELRRAGHTIKVHRVQDAGALIGALDRQRWDLVISDWSMPNFNARQALSLVRAVAPDVPFIIVSGTIGEENAVAAMRAGANDYVLKEKLVRLAPAVERELHETRVRRDRRNAKEALRESETRFRQMAEGMRDVFWLVDAEKRQMLYVSPAYERIWGRTCQSLYASPGDWLAAVHDEDRAKVMQGRVSRPASVTYEEEYRIVRPDGAVRWIRDHASPLRDASGAIVSIAGVAEDITERHGLEDQLRQAQKLEAIGSLAGGVAHDFNNLLSVILTYSEFLKTSLDPASPLLADVEEIAAAGHRAADLTRQLLAFSRRQILQPKVIDLNEILTGMEKMLRRLLGEDVELSAIPSSAPAVVNVDPGQMEQVMMNLAVNARDAMPGGGKLTIEVGHVDLDDAYAAAHPQSTPGRHVMLAVSDNGSGMDAATQARVFEPFFTTKELGKGTGLGLSTVFGIVRQSAGTIWLYSELGKGTTFKVYLPVAGQPVDNAAQRSAELVRLQGTEIVLLVEDEEGVRKGVRSILQRSGYRVLDAPGGPDALLLSEEHHHIDLLLTDVVMPRMSGAQLAARLQAIRPELKVLYMSGYTENAVVLHGVLSAEVAFVQKPITPAALLTRVREVLDSPSLKTPAVPRGPSGEPV